MFEPPCSELKQLKDEKRSRVGSSTYKVGARLRGLVSGRRELQTLSCCGISLYPAATLCTEHERLVAGGTNRQHISELLVQQYIQVQLLCLTHPLANRILAPRLVPPLLLWNSRPSSLDLVWRAPFTVLVNKRNYKPNLAAVANTSGKNRRKFADRKKKESAVPGFRDRNCCFSKGRISSRSHVPFRLSTLLQL